MQQLSWGENKPTEREARAMRWARHRPTIGLSALYLLIVVVAADGSYSYHTRVVWFAGMIVAAAVMVIVIRRLAPSFPVIPIVLAAGIATFALVNVGADVWRQVNVLVNAEITVAEIVRDDESGSMSSGHHRVVKYVYEVDGEEYFGFSDDPEVQTAKAIYVRYAAHWPKLHSIYFNENSIDFR